MQDSKGLCDFEEKERINLEMNNFYSKTICKRQKDKMLSVKKKIIPRLKSSHQYTESATSTSAFVETGSKKGRAKTERK